MADADRSPMISNKSFNKVLKGVIASMPAIPYVTKRRSSMMLPFVLGGAGLAAIGGGVFLRMNADADADRLHGTCAPTCDPSERAALGDQLVLSNVALGVGAVALTASAVTWLLARK